MSTHYFFKNKVKLEEQCCSLIKEWQNKKIIPKDDFFTHLLTLKSYLLCTEKIYVNSKYLNK